MVDDRSGQVDQDHAQFVAVHVDTEGHGGHEAQQGPGLADAHVPGADRLQHAGGDQAGHDLGHRLRGQPAAFGQVHPGQRLAATGQPEDDGVVVAA
ncbi:hypothetical protein GCM10029964_095340 [Kibdelosporangium lantanae]